MLDTKEMTLKQIEEWLIEHNAVCKSCCYPIQQKDLESYPHEQGHKVVGCYCKQWIHTNCKVCGYESALWKLKQQIDVWKEKRRNTDDRRRNEAIVGKPQAN